MFTLLSATTFLAGSEAHAQSIIIDVPGSADIPVAAPKPALPAGGPAAQAEEMWQALWKDLEISGYFKLQDPRGYLEKDAGVEPGQFDLGSWSTIKTSVLVKTRVWPAGHASCDPGGPRMCADVYVYHVPSGEKLASKRFRGTPEAARTLGHAVANHVLLVTTGHEGVFDGRLAAVGSRSGNKEIYVMDLDGHGIQPVTKNGSINLSPAWSPDGGEIAYTSYKMSNPDLYVKDLGTGRTRALSNIKGVNTSPDFSPDGGKIAMARSVDADSDLFLVDARTGAELRRLTTGGGIDVSPDFALDGSRIVFASERSGGSQVYSMPAGGGDATRLTFTGDFNIDPVLSPDGTKIAYVGRSGGGFDIYVCDVDGRNAIRLTQGMGDNEDPTWSPDGRYVVFGSTRTGRSELWISTADGRHQTRLTDSGGWTQPAWAPRGGK